MTEPTPRRIPTPEELDALEPAMRQKLAELWARDALLEHASIASFARFSLHLLAVGAPPDLLDATHQAAIDEVNHAKMCFALASAYAGQPLGPGPLPLDGDVLGALDLASVTAAAVTEGCVGETLASLEAEAAAEVATVPAIRDVLNVIADDEGRHAELAWRFVRWAIDQGNDQVREAARQAFAEALARTHRDVLPSDPSDALLAAHGRLSEPRRLVLHDEGLAEVIAPAATALLGSPP